MSDFFGFGTAVSGGLTAAATMSAAQTQADAVNHATDTAQNRYLQTRGDLSPYNDNGRAALATLNNDLIPNYGQDASNYSQQMISVLPGQTLQDGANYLPRLQDHSVVPVGGMMTQAQLEATPGYQFDLAQGQKAVASSAAARGLGVSGAAMKGAAQYATGLADNTYQNQFNILQQQFADQLNKDNQNFGQQNTSYNDILNLRQGQFNQAQAIEGDWNNLANFSQNNYLNRINALNGQSSLGENAGAQTGSVGASLAASGGGQAIAGAGQIGNTITSGANGLASTLNNYLNGRQQNNLLQQYLGGGTGGTGGAFDSAGGSYGAGGSNNGFASTGFYDE